MQFCPGCSQRTDTARLTFVELARDLLHTFTNIERGPWAMLRSLVTRPGHMARDYVEGRRRRYYGPFATLATLVGATALVVNLSGYEMLAQDGFAEVASDLLQRYFNLLLLLQLPLLGGACTLLFRGAGLRLPEHMVLVAYTLGFRAIVLMTTVPIVLLANDRAAPTGLQVIGFWAAWYLYFAWAATQFYPGPALRTAPKALVAAALGHAAMVGVVHAGTWVWLHAAPQWAGK